MTELQTENTLDRKDLKIQALIEKNAQVTNENADLRVELTILDSEFQKAQTRIQELEALVPKDTEVKTDEAN